MPRPAKGDICEVWAIEPGVSAEFTNVMCTSVRGDFFNWIDSPESTIKNMPIRNINRILENQEAQSAYLEIMHITKKEEKHGH